MSSFDVLGRRIIVEAGLEDYKLTPEFVFETWLKSRYRSILTHDAFGSINKQDNYGFNTIADVTTDTVGVINGDATVTSATAVFTTAMVGRYFTVGTDAVWYRIASRTSAAEIELDTAYLGETETEATYRIAQRYYEIDASIRWIVDILLGGRYGLIKVSAEKLDEIAPMRFWQASVPQYWAPVGWNQTNGKRIVEIYPPSDQEYRLDAVGYLNLSEPTLTGSPFVGIDDRLLIEGCLSDALKYRAAKETSVETIRGLLDIARSHEKDYERLMLDLERQESKDMPRRRIRLHWRSGQQHIQHDIVTAEQEVFYNRPPY